MLPLLPIQLGPLFRATFWVAFSEGPPGTPELVQTAIDSFVVKGINTNYLKTGKCKNTFKLVSFTRG
jgi:hypothetical protein